MKSALRRANGLELPEKTSDTSAGKPCELILMKYLGKKIRNNTENILILLFAFIWNQSVYSGARRIAETWHHFNMTTPIDTRIPFVPWTVSIYLGCYAFWIINYCLCAAQPKPERDRFFCADIMAKGICFIFFLLIPTTNIRPEITGSNIWETLVRFIYRMDAADNLFPSIHCLVSWLCWTGVRKRSELPFIYRCFSLTAALAVCISTLTVKQHVIPDVIAGILIAEACYFLSGFPEIRRYYSSFISFLYSLIR